MSAVKRVYSEVIVKNKNNQNQSYTFKQAVGHY